MTEKCDLCGVMGKTLVFNDSLSVCRDCYDLLMELVNWEIENEYMYTGGSSSTGL